MEIRVFDKAIVHCVDIRPVVIVLFFVRVGGHLHFKRPGFLIRVILPLPNPLPNIPQWQPERRGHFSEEKLPVGRI